MHDITKRGLMCGAAFLLGTSASFAAGAIETRYKRYREVKHTNQLTAEAEQVATHIREEMIGIDYHQVLSYAADRQQEIRSRRLEHLFSSKNAYNQVGDAIDATIDAAVKYHVARSPFGCDL